MLIEGSRRVSKNWAERGARRLLAAAARRRAQVGPLNAAVRHAPARVREALDVDELVGRALVLRAASAAVGVGARIEDGDDNRLARARLEAEVVELERREVGRIRRTSAPSADNPASVNRAGPRFPENKRPFG